MVGLSNEMHCELLAKKRKVILYVFAIHYTLKWFIWSPLLVCDQYMMISMNSSMYIRSKCVSEILIFISDCQIRSYMAKQ